MLNKLKVGPEVSDFLEWFKMPHAPDSIFYEVTPCSQEAALPLAQLSDPVLALRLHSASFLSILIGKSGF